MKKVLIALALLLLFPAIAYARIGVGVATGKVVVNEKLKPGLLYKLPPLSVVNTGDQVSDYEVTVTYHQNQKQLLPAENWFIFSPKEFRLQPGKVQVVQITLNLPLTAQPGDYFAYLEAHPLQKSQNGKTTIAIAAAAKLYFTIIPANIFQAIYYKLVTFWQVYAPWTHWTAIILGSIAVILFLKRFLHIEIQLKKPPSSKDKSKNNLSS